MSQMVLVPKKWKPGSGRRPTTVSRLIIYGQWMLHVEPRAVNFEAVNFEDHQLCLGQN
jgi:hypothetical protein